MTTTERCYASKIDGDGDGFRCKKLNGHDGDHDFDTACGHVSPIGISMVCSLPLGHDGMHKNQKKMSSWPTQEQNQKWSEEAKREDSASKIADAIIAKDPDAVLKTFSEAVGEVLGEAILKDPIRPNYYHGTSVDDFIQEFNLSFRLGSVVKYVARHEHKNKVEDLKKALWYLQREIEQLDKPKELDPDPIIEAAKGA